MDAAGVIGLIIGTVVAYLALYFIIRSAVTAAIRAARDDAPRVPTAPAGSLTPSEERFFGKDATPPSS